jgi:hypothetical protein
MNDRVLSESWCVSNEEVIFPVSGYRLLAQLTVYSAVLAFLLRLLILPEPNLAFRAAYNLGVAKSAAIWVGWRSTFSA